MDMYIRMYDELKRTEHDNPTIGIILCADTDDDIARYSIMHGNDQLFYLQHQEVRLESAYSCCTANRRMALLYLHSPHFRHSAALEVHLSKKIRPEIHMGFWTDSVL